MSNSTTARIQSDDSGLALVCSGSASDAHRALPAGHYAKLLGPVKWTYFYLYVILDIFSRYVVGWMVAEGESAELAKRLIGETCRKQNIAPDQLTIHADRGTSMTSKPVALLLADLGVTKTHSRPHVSDDNPFSESQFKTLKYWPEFPERFGSTQDARAVCQSFFPWYNAEHHHSGIGLLTPEVLHYGRADEVIAKRQVVLTLAFQRNPDSFVRAQSRPPARPTAGWINPPPVTAASDQEQHEFMQAGVSKSLTNSDLLRRAAGGVVAKVGVEPTRTVKCARF